MSIKMSPAEALIGIISRFTPSIPINEQVPAAKQRIAQLHKTRKKLEQSLQESIKSYKRFANLKRSSEPVLKVGDYVYLNTTNLPLS